MYFLSSEYKHFSERRRPAGEPLALTVAGARPANVASPFNCGNLCRPPQTGLVQTFLWTDLAFGQVLGHRLGLRPKSLGLRLLQTWPSRPSPWTKDPTDHGLPSKNLHTLFKGKWCFGTHAMPCPVGWALGAHFGWGPVSHTDLTRPDQT